MTKAAEVLQITEIGKIIKFAIIIKGIHSTPKSVMLNCIYPLRWMQGAMERRDRRPQKQRCRLSNILLSRQPSGCV